MVRGVEMVTTAPSPSPFTLPIVAALSKVAKCNTLYTFGPNGTLLPCVSRRYASRIANMKSMLNFGHFNFSMVTVALTLTLASVLGHAAIAYVFLDILKFSGRACSREYHLRERDCAIPIEPGLARKAGKGWARASVRLEECSCAGF